MFGLAVIESFVPREAGRAFGTFLRLFPDWFAKRHAAFVTPMLLPWLVGAAEVNDVPEKYEAKGSEEEEHMVPANAFEGLVGRRSQKRVQTRRSSKAVQSFGTVWVRVGV